jgi:uncharacterized membrane protein
MVLKIARFVNLFLVALLAGLLVGVFIVELALLEVSASVYTAVEKPKHELFEPIMPVVNTLVIGSGLLVVLSLMRDRKTWVFGLTALGVVCTIALTTTTLLVNVPINSEIINTWSVNDPPTDWTQVRDRWNLFHAVRTVLAVAALFCLLLAAMIPQPKQYPSHEVTFGSGEERM